MILTTSNVLSQFTYDPYRCSSLKLLCFKQDTETGNLVNAIQNTKEDFGWSMIDGISVLHFGFGLNVLVWTSGPIWNTLAKIHISFLCYFNTLDGSTLGLLVHLFTKGWSHNWHQLHPSTIWSTGFLMNIQSPWIFLTIKL